MRALRAKLAEGRGGNGSANSRGFDAEMRRYVFFFPLRLYMADMAQVLTWGVGMQPGLSVRLTVVQLNLKPEAPLSALLPTNNEIERFLGGREHDRTTRCFIDSGDRKYSFLRLETYELKRHVHLHKFAFRTASPSPSFSLSLFSFLSLYFLYCLKTRRKVRHNTSIPGLAGGRLRIDFSAL